MVNKLIVNKLLIVFTYLRNDSVFDFAWETGASRADNFCCSGRPQISSFSLTMQRYKKFIVLPNYFSKKARKKARMLKNTLMRLKSQISVFILLPPLYRKLLKVYNNIIYILYYYKNIIINIFLFILSPHTPHAFF